MEEQNARTHAGHGGGGGKVLDKKELTVFGG